MFKLYHQSPGWGSGYIYGFVPMFRVNYSGGIINSPKNGSVSVYRDFKEAQRGKNTR